MRGAIVGLDHVQVAAPRGCEAEARAFYGGLLGLEELVKPPRLAGRGGAWFSLGAGEIHVGVDDAFTPARQAHPALLVDPERLDELAGALRDAGHPTVWDAEIPEVRRFFTADPWGNRLGLVAEGRSEWSV